eukprot:scaffold10175_cov268-Chaetoceros_neogracile.AAC.15
MFGAENDRCSLSICSSEGGSLYSCDCYSSSFDDLDGYLGIDENTKVDYNSSMAQLYRAIDTKSLEDASKWIRNDPGMAKSWVYRRNKNTNEIMWNFLPLHSACFAHAPIAVVKELIRVHPQSVYITAPGDKLPIHIACETAASPDVVTCLVSAYPEALIDQREDSDKFGYREWKVQEEEEESKNLREPGRQ